MSVPLSSDFNADPVAALPGPPWLLDLRRESWELFSGLERPRESEEICLLQTSARISIGATWRRFPSRSPVGRSYVTHSQKATAEFAHNAVSPLDDGSSERGRCLTLRKGVEWFVVRPAFNPVIVVQQELLDGPKAVSCLLVREPLGRLVVEPVWRNAGDGSVTAKAKELLARQGLISVAQARPDRRTGRRLRPSSRLARSG